MYFILIWDDELLEYVPEFQAGTRKRIAFDTWGEADEYIMTRYAEDGKMRRSEYKGMRKRVTRP